MIMLTENAIAAEKAALGSAKPAEGRIQDLHRDRAASAAAGNNHSYGGGSRRYPRKMRPTAPHNGAVPDPDDAAPAAEIGDLETDGLRGAGLLAHPVGPRPENAREGE